MMTEREQMIADLRQSLIAAGTLCSADDFRRLRHAVERYVDTPLAAGTPVAGTPMVRREDVKRGMSALLDLIRAVARQQAALAGRSAPRRNLECRRLHAVLCRTHVLLICLSGLMA
jgi:hypothetical protein